MSCIPKDHSFNSKEDFIRCLEEWLGTCQSEYVGHGPPGGNEPWIWVELERDELYLNADSRRHGVNAFVENHRAGYTDWHVILNERRKSNKVTNGQDKKPVDSFFLYVKRPGQRTIK